MSIFEYRRLYIMAGLVILFACGLLFAPLLTPPALEGTWYSFVSNAPSELRPDGTTRWMGYEGRYEVDGDILRYMPYAPMLGNLYTDYRIVELTRGRLVLEPLPARNPPRYIAFSRDLLPN